MTVEIQRLTANYFCLVFVPVLSPSIPYPFRAFISFPPTTLKTLIFRIYILVVAKF
jgi:hypothetical protein